MGQQEQIAKEEWRPKRQTGAAKSDACVFIHTDTHTRRVRQSPNIQLVIFLNIATDG